ncbi:alpha-L-arabinofuranosidase C-terminal domain-containing protein [Prevotella sp. tf2-5]|uniref:alpha-L-arabinofuranosidase C-terminal domain-containing protein n=1 Tax=Prevotella sp. tf2-5 TaxID=1761889 RepID=UPI0008F0EC0A|nr:alpha-L-arabinofuranosidase C-terminal domain-containing protein [Prevotella sp. tf2-5]SFO61345.1 Alpha-L-arabinofuranosidase [Prevotella sp. tf2-5]
MRRTITLCLFAICVSAMAQNNTIEVNTKKIGAPIQSTMYGIFFEDINYAADGGLYGELVKNRSFEFPQHLMGWQAFGCVDVEDDNAPFERCPHYVILSDPGHKDRRSGLVNEGYFGIGIEKGEAYRFSVWAKAPKGTAVIRVQLIKENSMDEKQEFVEEEINITSSQWKKYTVTLNAPQTEKQAKLRIFLKGTNSVALEHISLFPVNTFKNRENGMRRDLAQALADLKPGIFRFPGGCIVEGTDLATRYQWKNTLGPVENRPLNGNRWEHTFDYRYYPDYYQSYGLGFFEFFQLSEDIGAEPLPILSVGLACQYQNWNDESAHVPMDELQPYIDDCLDLIEFANGPVTSKWGKVRADMGHPAPFNMKYIGVGNEQWGEFYYERLKPFVAAIRAKYPDIKIVGTSGPVPEDVPDNTYRFEDGWKAMKAQKADLVDEHYYRDEEWFLTHGLRYDTYDRKGPKVFAGEYACHGKGKKWNHYEAAILEAAFMTGFERNADIVHMTTPAPLFAHVDGWQWRPDQIWYDNTDMFKTVSYYVQQMYSTNAGTNVLSLTMDKKPVANQAGQNGLFASAAYDSKTDEVIIKIANTSKTSQPVSFNLTGMKGTRTAQTLTLFHNGMDDENTICKPELITPQKGTTQVDEGKGASLLLDDLPPMSFRIYRIRK